MHPDDRRKTVNTSRSDGTNCTVVQSCQSTRIDSDRRSRTILIAARCFCVGHNLSMLYVSKRNRSYETCQKAFSRFLIIQNASVSSSCADASTAIPIFLSLQKKAERTFSKSKLIKKYLRSVMTQGRLISFR